MTSPLGRFAVRNVVPITFVVVAACLAGAYAATHMASSLFPRTDFPRVVILVENGMTPADEMSATVTRPIEEAMKDIAGTRTIRSATGRGTAEIDLFFSWDTDVRQAELYALSRLAEIRPSLPSGVSTSVYRMTFATFPIIGIGLTGGDAAHPTDAWEAARYTIKPRLLRVPGVARVELVGGHALEFSVVVDPVKLAALHLDLARVNDALAKQNLVSAAGLLQEDHSLYLAVVDGRVRDKREIEDLVIPAGGGRIVRVKDFATVERGPEPSFQAVTADGADAVLLNVYAQPDASILDIAAAVRRELRDVRRDLPPGPRGPKLSTFYDQSLLVHSSVRSVWDAIAFGLILSVVILYLFLKSWRMTLVATLVIPVTVLFTILAMRLCGLSFNLMTLGGIAAAIGLVIDDAIVVVEAIHARRTGGRRGIEVIESAVGEILPPLLGSTLTPVVVFLPLAFLEGVAGVFFRALALTMIVALLTSLLLALTLTPSLAAWLIRERRDDADDADSPRDAQAGGPVMRRVILLYEIVVRLALAHPWFTSGLCVLVLGTSAVLYNRLKTDFLPKMDEGGFVIDYIAPPGTSLAETDRQMREAEAILRSIPEVESYSRRTGAALGVHLVEPNTGDFLVKLKDDRKRPTQAVISDVRRRFYSAFPRINWEFPGILTDLIGDLTWSDEPIEVKLFSPDLNVLKSQAIEVERKITSVRGVVDVSNGLIYTGPSIRLRVRGADAARYGLTTDAIANAVNIALLGQTSSTVVEADRVVNVRLKADPAATSRIETLRQLPLRAADGTILRLDQVTDVEEARGELELHRNDLRQDVAVTANLDGRDLGGAISEIRSILDNDPTLPHGAIEYGGLYQEQQQSFRNLAVVLATAIALVFTVALLEFGSFYEPIAIVFGAAVSVFGITLALLLTGTSLNIVAFLGAIIGMGIVHKNGLLMLDGAKNLQAAGMDLHEALVQSGRRRLRPVLMTSLAAALGMLPLAFGIGAADMLKPLAVTVIGAVCISVLLSLVATPAAYYLMKTVRR